MRTALSLPQACNKPLNQCWRSRGRSGGKCPELGPGAAQQRQMPRERLASVRHVVVLCPWMTGISILFA